MLDMAEYKLDDGEWREKEEILRLDNNFRAEVGYPMRADAYAQPWIYGERAYEHKVALRRCHGATADRRAVAKGCRTLPGPSGLQAVQEGILDIGGHLPLGPARCILYVYGRYGTLHGIIQLYRPGNGATFHETGHPPGAGALPHGGRTGQERDEVSQPESSQAVRSENALSISSRTAPVVSSLPHFSQ